MKGTPKMSPETYKKLIDLINKALGLVYDTTHPMTKVAISQALSDIKTILVVDIVGEVFDDNSPS